MSLFIEAGRPMEPIGCHLIRVHCLSFNLAIVNRFLDMVRSGFFETEVPLFRALKNFLVQFGLAGMEREFIFNAVMSR